MSAHAGRAQASHTEALSRMSLAWQDDALCGGLSSTVFFQECSGVEGTRNIEMVKKMCQRCAVRQQCLEYALANDERWGIWGGTTERERRRMLKGGAA